MPDLDLTAAMDVARRAAAAAAAAALPHFRAGVRVETKPDRTPVTAADRAAEAAALGVIRAAFPGHGTLGEETGEHRSDGEARWIVDPVDGTRGFVRGGTFWGPLVALEHRGSVVAGAMALPALGETYWAARGLGCFLGREGAAPRRLRVSAVADWSEENLQIGEPRTLLAPPLGERVVALARSCASARAYGDLAGCAMLLTGVADAWIESGVQIWDLAPLQVLVEEAGGRFTDFRGKPTVRSGEAVATNGLLHAHLLRALAGG